MDMSELRERLARIETLQGAHNTQLADHMERTRILEERQDAFFLTLAKIETRFSVALTVGAALIPLASLLLQLWKSFQ